jgi:hypothetical protein
MIRRQASRRAAQSGSAYIIALLVLLVLSILGLSLALISQTEVRLGANELTTHRALYGGEAGVHLAVARVLTVNSSVDNASVTAVTPMTFTLPERRFTLDYTDAAQLRPTVVEDAPGIGETHFAEHVQVSPFVPIQDTFCDMCPAAEGDVQLLNVNHALVATSERIAWNGDDEPTEDEIEDARRTARKQLYLMVGLQPWWPPRWESIADDLQTKTIVQETMGGAADGSF